MNGEERKLKRGLKDISTLFVDDVASAEGESFAEKPIFFKCVAVYQPFKEKIQYAPFRLAKALSEHQIPCTVLSIGRVSSIPPESGVSNVPLDWPAFESLCHKPLPLPENGKLQSQMVLFNFDDRHPRYLHAIVPILDRWIFLVPPSLDGVMEAYRMMKGTRAITQGLLQYYIIFEGQKGEGEIDSFLFEKFSSLVSDRLGISLVWLGYLNNDSDSKASRDLDLDNFFLLDTSAVEVPAKFAILNYAAAMRGEGFGKAQHENL